MVEADGVGGGSGGSVVAGGWLVGEMSDNDNLFWRNRIIESGAADPQELAKGYNPDNWRHHPQIQRDALEDALDSIGVLQPVLFNRLSGKVIDGHLRIELAILKGQPLIPVNYVELTDDEEALALATLDAITEQAEPIPDKLAALLERTREMTADRPGLGAMLERLRERAGINGHQRTEETGPPPIDKAAELQKVWGTEVGQIWQLGNHRLAVGDCTDRATVEAMMSGERAEAVVTDPPYGVGVDYESFEDSPENAKGLIDTFMPIIQGMNVPIALTPGVPSMWFYPKPSWLMVWIHPAPAGSCPWGFAGVNPILVYGDDPYLKNGLGRRPDSIVMAADREGAEGHPTPKPVKVWTWLVERLTTKANQVIFDPFLGSGTTMVAAHQLNRRCFGIEIEPSYVAVTLERMSNLGITPHRLT